MSHRHITPKAVTSPIVSHKSEAISNSNIYFYREHRPEHTCFINVNDYSKSLMQIHSEEFAQKQFWILCALPNNKVLCFWHHNQKDSSILFSLDSQGNIFKFKIPSHKEISRAIAVYYKNDMVYIFGFKKWYKLDMYRNIYFTIFGGNNHTYYSCALINDYVIISNDWNCHTFEVYDILTNSKSTMTTIDIGGPKHLFTLQENLYAVDSDGYLYSIGLWNWNEWKYSKSKSFKT